MYILKPHIPADPTAGILVNEDHVADRVVNRLGHAWFSIGPRKKNQGVGLALGTILSKLRYISPSINIAKNMHYSGGIILLDLVCCSLMFEVHDETNVSEIELLH